MSALSWNCRGLRGAATIRHLKNLCKVHNPLVVGLIETKVSNDRINQIRWKVGFKNGFNVFSRGKSGGLSIWWKEGIDVTICNYSDFHIDARISGEHSFRFTLFYGNPRTGKREETWNLLRKLNGLADEPWLIFGDFNELLFSWEFKGRHLRGEWQMRRFREVLLDCNLLDVSFRGNKYTFSNNRKGSEEFKARLDRALANKKWKELYPMAEVKHEARIFSDHAPLVICWRGMKKFVKTKLFRFEPMWLRKENFNETASSLWREAENHNVFLSDCLKNTAIGLTQWSSENFGEFKKKINRIKEDILKVQQDFRTEESAYKEASLSRELGEWYLREELYWKQRARIDWLKEGDLNTKFFHSKASHRKNINRIDKLRSTDGRWVESEIDIGCLVMEHFNSIFKSSRTSASHICTNSMEFIPEKISDDMRMSLEAEFTELEVQEALFQMCPTKAPGIDGFSALYYQKGWSFLRHKVTSCVLQILKKKELEQGMNKTIVTLIPKKKNSENISDFRPISLCNVSAKLVTKVLANRIKPLLSTVISEVQSAFIPGKHISDNVLIAHEVLHYIRTRRNIKTGYLALKLDMSKAYDRVEWDFLKLMLLRLGFPDQFVKLLMMCTTSVSYMFKINGILTEEIWPERGIRQGDPISPYLFLICTEWLTNKMLEMQVKGKIKGIKVCPGAPEITHLFFADDSLFFMRANVENVITLKKVLDEYELLSGQQINCQKSEVVFSNNVPISLRSNICSILGISEVNSISKYLGMPVSFSYNKSESFRVIGENVWNKVHSWNARNLSIAGKAVLIKAVVQALPTYLMSCFKIPDSIIRRMISSIANFWWSNRDNCRGIHWCKFRNLCRSTESGGLNFRDLALFNDAMLGKQYWKLIQSPDSLVSRILKAKYYRGTTLLNCNLGHSPSLAWRSIWLAGSKIKSQILFDDFNQKWKWNSDSCGEYTVRSAYHWLSNGSMSNVLNKDGTQADDTKMKHFWQIIWGLRIQPKIKFFAWRLYHNFLPSARNLGKKNIISNLKCHVCGYHVEDIMHTLTRCWWSVSFWKHFEIHGNVLQHDFTDPGDWLWFCTFNFSASDLGKIIYGARFIWFNRNNMAAGEMGKCPIQSARNSSVQSGLEGNCLLRLTTTEGNDGSLWSSPKSGTLKWNIDGSWCENSKIGGIGSICRDGNGCVIYVHADYICNVNTSFEAELFALQAAMYFAQDEEQDMVIFETDCATLFSSIMAAGSPYSQVSDTIRKCKNLLAHNKNWFLQLIFREANQVADFLARKAREEKWIWTKKDAIPMEPTFSALL